MSVITCQKCGAENRLGQLFCSSCGVKLDLSKVSAGRGSTARGSGGGRGLARAIRLVILLGLMATLGLLCWPAVPAGDAPSAEGARVVPAKMSALRGAIMRRNDVTETFSEADINAHLQATLVRPDPAAGGYRLVLRDVRLAVGPDRVEVWMKSALGPLPISYTADVDVRREDGRFIFAPGAVRIGRLPVPGPVRTRTLGQMTGIFQQLQEEWALLNRLPVVNPRDGLLEVSTTAP
ncbi:MAG TPA: zinc ribbon domain-containing protein [Kiritimatiellia bacterium]|nr:zinc ribbon domain-containing protein [Kiritimatiellia bacterium]HMO98805.1 zinc ribbon domain-containing protein [Kiritimatiellia bacterium]HMP96862.1 zinc ribbon domain-containing protein [Kiritimatiellia bacterium]